MPDAVASLRRQSPFFRISGSRALTDVDSANARGQESKRAQSAIEGRNLMQLFPDDDGIMLSFNGDV